MNRKTFRYIPLTLMLLTPTKMFDNETLLVLKDAIIANCALLLLFVCLSMSLLFFSLKQFISL